MGERNDIKKIYINGIELKDVKPCTITTKPITNDKIIILNINIQTYNYRYNASIKVRE